MCFDRQVTSGCIQNYQQATLNFVRQNVYDRVKAKVYIAVVMATAWDVYTSKTTPQIEAVAPTSCRKICPGRLSLIKRTLINFGKTKTCDTIGKLTYCSPEVVALIKSFLSWFVIANCSAQWIGHRGLYDLRPADLPYYYNTTITTYRLESNRSRTEL